MNKIYKNRNQVRTALIKMFDEQIFDVENAVKILYEIKTPGTKIYLDVIFSGFAAWVIAPGDLAFRRQAMRVAAGILAQAEEKRIISYKSKGISKKKPAEDLNENLFTTQLYEDIYIPLGGIKGIISAGRISTLRSCFIKNGKNSEFNIRCMQILHVIAEYGNKKHATIIKARSILNSIGIEEKYATKLAILRKLKSKNEINAEKTDIKGDRYKAKTSIENAWAKTISSIAFLYAATFIKFEKDHSNRNKYDSLYESLICGDLKYETVKEYIDDWMELAKSIRNVLIENVRITHKKNNPQMFVINSNGNIQIPIPNVSLPDKESIIKLSEYK